MSTSKPQKYWNPYAAGFGLGTVLLLSYLIAGQGLGASGAFARFEYFVFHLFAPQAVENHPVMGSYFADGANPLDNFLVYLILGVFTGGFISGILAGRFKKAVDKGPRITVKIRYILALSGGIIMGFAARMARGCTSGQALSGGAALGLGSWALMMCFFAGGFIGAYFLRRQWQ